MRKRNLWIGLLACAALVGLLAWWPSDVAPSSTGGLSLARPSPELAPDSASAPKLDARTVSVTPNEMRAPNDVASAAFLVARLVDEAKDPLGRLDIGVTLNVRSAQSGNASVSVPVTTDALGGFRVALPVPSANDVAGTLSVCVTSRGPSKDAQATFQLPDTIHPGDNELGDIVAFARTVLLAGTVTDDGRSPVPSAAITAVLQGPGLEPTEFHATSDDYGNFRIVSEKLDGMLRVTVRRDGWMSPPSESISAGTRNVRLKLSYGGMLAGRLLFDDGFPVQEVELVLSDPRSAAGDFFSKPKRFSNIVQADGTFELKRLDSGIMNLRVTHGDVGTLALIEKIQLRAGKKLNDPRVSLIDIRGKVRSLRVTVVDEEERPVREGMICSSASGSPSGLSKVRDGRALLLLRDPTCDLTVEATGYRPVSLTNVGSDQRIVLKRGIPVRVRWRAGVAMPDPRFSVGVSLFTIPEKPRPIITCSDRVDTGKLWFDSNGEVTAALPVPGQYWAAWTLQKKGGSNPANRSARPGSRETLLTVLDSDVEQVFNFAPNPTEFSDALKSLDE
jgi:hypothetical protein